MKLLISFLLWLNFSASLSQHFVAPSSSVISEILDAGFSQQDALAILQGDLENVKKKLDDLQKHDSQKYNKLLMLINSNKNQLALLNRYTLAINCGDAISKGDFEQAKNLLKFVFASNYDEVIYRSYKNSSESFGNVLKFANFVYYPKHNNTLLLYQELFKQSKPTVTVDDLVNMTTFIKELYNNSDWTDLKKQVLNVVVRKASVEIRSYFKSGNKFFTQGLSYRIVNKIYNCDHGAGLDLVMDIVEKMDKDVNVCDILVFVSYMSNEYLQMQGYIAFKQYRQPGNCIIQFLVAIRKTLQLHRLDADVKKRLTSLVESFPDQVRGVAYSDKLCIRNVMSGHYLKLADMTGNGTWKIVISPGEEMYERTKWMIESSVQYARFFLKNSFTSHMIAYKDLKYYASSNQYCAVEVELWDDGVYIKLVTSNDIIFFVDVEGYLRYDKYFEDLDNFSKWTLKAC